MPKVRCPVLVGRDAELGLVLDALHAARRGRGSALAVVGDPGMGKSRLVGDVVKAARPGTPALVGRATGDGQPAAFRPLVEALLGGLRAAGDVDRSGLGPFLPALGRLLPQFRTGTVDLDDSPVVLAEGVLRLLRALAAGRGLMLVLEDLQWADPETLAVVEYLADNLREAPLLLVLTTRADPSPHRALVRRLVDRGSASELELVALTAAAVAEMATACLPDPPAAEVIGLLLSRAEGVPLLVEELLGAGLHLGEYTAVPATVAELTRFRLGAVPEAARQCVRSASMFGHRFDWELLVGATGLSREVVLDGLRSAVEAQLVETGPDGSFAFRHALTRDAVIGSLLPPEQTALARRAWESVEAAHPVLDEPWGTLAARLAATAGEPERAGALFRDAGRRDLARGALASAEAALLRARTLAGSNVELAAEIDEALAEVFVLAGQPERAAEVTGRLVEVLRMQQAAPRRLALAHLRLARAWTVAGDWPAAAEQVARTRALTGEDAGLGARADLVDAHVALGRNDFDTARTLAGSVLAATEHSGPFELTCEALELLGRLARRQDLEAAEALFARGSAVAASRDLTVWHVRALHELGTIDALDSMRLDRLNQARDAALRAGALAVATDVEFHIAAVHLVRGELLDCLRMVRSCTDSARRLMLPTVPMATVIRAGAHLLSGETSEALELLDEALRAAPDDPITCAEAWQFHVMRWLLAEDRARAMAAADRAMGYARRASAATSLPAVGRWALLATLERGDDALDEVRRLPGALVARWTVGFVGFAESVRLGRRGRSADAEATFLAADTAMTSPVPMPHFRHMSRRLVIEAAITDGWGDPARWLVEDLDYFESIGQHRTATACRHLLRRVGAPVPRRTPGPEVPARLRRHGVTGREMEVLLLVNDGLSNREIAARLFLSHRTVEKHVERLLDKAGLRHRRELDAWR